MNESAATRRRAEEIYQVVKEARDSAREQGRQLGRFQGARDLLLTLLEKGWLSPKIEWAVGEWARNAQQGWAVLQADNTPLVPPLDRSRGDI